MTKYFVNTGGEYLGGYDGATPPSGSIEVQTPPFSGLDLWDGAKWVSAPAPVPQSVTMRQARLALLGAGLLDTVETAIAAAGPAAKIEWEYAQEVQRASGLVPAMATALGMTDAQIDSLFVTAATL